MPDQHAVLSASSSHRWLACPPSALLCARERDSPGAFALQGTDAHSLCEYKVRKAIGMDAEDPTENLTYLDEEMMDATDQYEQFVMEQVAAARERCADPIVLVEQRLDFSRWVPDGFGTGDCVIVADEVLTVIDFKYGLGVLVSAEENTQMMCYALGALSMFDDIYDIREVQMTIFQPRRENVSTYAMTRDELLTWAENTLAPTARLAAEGGGEFCAGSHCQFCKVKAVCRKRADENMALAALDFADPALLSDEEIEAVLAKADELTSWASDVKEYALQQAVSGKEWHGWKLVEGRSSRKYVNEDAAAEAVKAAGYDPYEHKVLGITAMTKLLGRSRFDELLGGLVTRPQGRPTLVPQSDKRPAMHSAANDFMEEN